MKPENEAIFFTTLVRFQIDEGSIPCHAIKWAIEKCEALAKPRELTDAEFDEIYKVYCAPTSSYNAIRSALAKHLEILARPAEPETVEFDYNEWRNGGWQAQYLNEDYLRGVTSWVDTDAVVQYQTLRMRRKP